MMHIDHKLVSRPIHDEITGALVDRDYQVVQFWPTSSNEPVRWTDFPVLIPIYELYDREIQVGRVYQFGQYRVRIIVADDSEWRLRVIAVPDTYRAWLYRLRYLCGRALHWLSVRLLLTAAIWGLASVEPSQVPSWRDLKLFKKETDHARTD